jgi:DNA repair exonuclease SbcCD nuclease subunit
MDDSSLQILCTGDVHLGRRPSRVPVDDDTLSVRHVWDRFVETALDRAVDVVVLTGDVVDSENQMYEAYGALERGIRRLVDGDVEVVAVAGNHDHEAFPRLMRSIDADGVHLLGPGGTWDEVRVDGRNGPSVRFVGWSFPQATHVASPLESLSLSEAEIPTLGVLHCETGGSEGPYAPVQRSALARTPVTAWLLGHVHAPNAHREAGQLQLYPGSLQPLDPGEPGLHGAWVVEVAGDAVTAESLPLASLRYDEASVDVSALETPEDVEDAVIRTVRDGIADASDRGPHLTHVAYRIVIEGRTDRHREIRATVDEMVSSLRPEFDQVTGSIEAVDLQTRPDHDLEALARSDDPAGVLARLLVRLEEESVDPDRVHPLLRRASKAVRQVHDSSRYEPLRRDSETRDPPDREALQSLLYRQGLLLLDALHDRRD